ncbi:MAG: deoxyribodipyrimidine photo-lyase [Rhodobacteraceae bacterium]|nr:deoxyribodipyrimidine photo-lyase [Paracoccaceae bacterium]MCC6009164.1 deoxyribodipyrimidine photo-lyase [Paracoccaceae bacterium]
MADTSPIILWFRRDLRLADNPMLAEAAGTGRPLIPVFIRDPQIDGLGAAPKWRLGLALERFAETLAGMGTRLILRQGDAAAVLDALVSETGAGAVWWGRQYDAATRDRDAKIKKPLQERGIDARSFAGHVLFEPWEVETGSGGVYKVYSPYWRAVRDRAVPAPAPAPTALQAPQHWPASDTLADWALGAAMNRGADVVARHVCVGEDAARERLERFIDHAIDDYKTRRDFPDAEATSRLSENLTWGEIGIREVWHAGRRAMEHGARGAEHFLKELVWREFAWHLLYHHPRMDRENFRPEWSDFPWKMDADNDAVRRWKQGRTGVAFVDAAMREMYVTGTMHNRARMIVASYLTKHMLVHWKVGLDWFADCLIDWDPASNAMGWQWVAGSGPDAAPYFRVFNPALQADKFDADARYRRRFLTEGARAPHADALAFFDACPRSWGLAPDMAPPAPLVDLDSGRKRALAAYEALKADA